MESSSALGDKPNFWNRQKTKLNKVTEEFTLELSLIATIIFCYAFRDNLPSFGINPYAGKFLAGLGVFILFAIMTYRFKWPVIASMAAISIYIGIGFIQHEPAQKTAGTDKNSTIQQEGNPSATVTTYHLLSDTNAVQK